MRIKTLWREPLLHFLLIGAALFVYYDLARVGVSAERPSLAVSFECSSQRPPWERNR